MFIIIINNLIFLKRKDTIKENNLFNIETFCIKFNDINNNPCVVNMTEWLKHPAYPEFSDFPSKEHFLSNTIKDKIMKKIFFPFIETLSTMITIDAEKSTMDTENEHTVHP